LITGFYDVANADLLKVNNGATQHLDTHWLLLGYQDILQIDSG
jgi:hypothetical protein